MSRKIALLLAVLVPANVSFGLIYIDPDLHLRGDANSDGQLDISDMSAINNWLFNGGDEPPCLNQADANDDGNVDMTDSVYISNYLYNNGPPPPPPSYPNGSGSCGVDEEPRPGCKISPCS